MNDFQKHGLYHCNNCSLVFMKRIPSDQELQTYYTNAYDRTSYFSPITRKRYEELLDSFEPYRKTNRILDIGCGYGFFLEIAQKRGWEVYGSELTPQACETCEEKGIRTFLGELPENSFEKESFDVVVAIEVLEHLRSPLDYVKEIKNLLRQGGLLYLTTPNFNAYLRYRLKDKYDVIEYPNHLTYFTRRSLRFLFEKEGFISKKIETTGMSVTRYRTSIGRSNQDYVSETSDDEMIRYKIERNRLLRFTKNLANGILNQLKIGVSLKGSFEKS